MFRKYVVIAECVTLEVFGGEDTKPDRFSGHGEALANVAEVLEKPCPICLSKKDLTIDNTHTPSYSVECTRCELSLSGEYFDPSDSKTMEDFIGVHEQAVQNVIDKWKKQKG